MDTKSKKLTFGEKAVGVNKNGTGTTDTDVAIEKVKAHFAGAVDEIKKFSDETHSQEAMNIAEIAIREIQGASMRAVQAITWKD